MKLAIALWLLAILLIAAAAAIGCAIESSHHLVWVTFA